MLRMSIQFLQAIAFRKFLFFVALSQFISSCTQSTPKTSQLKIDSGLYIDQNSQNIVPGVVYLGNCTATAVSDNTLITAAHCVDRANFISDDQLNDKICVRSGNIANGKCSIALYMPKKYRISSRGEDRGYEYDVAVAVFESGTFKNFFKVQQNPAATGDKVSLVGYSQENPGSGSSSSKRWGYNKISKFDSPGEIVSEYARSVDGVAVSPGDSGGPLFSNQCEILGVASRMTVESNKKSLHTNLTWSENIAWMKGLEAKGAYFCGLSGLANNRCDNSGLASWDQKYADSRKEFPCGPNTAGSAAPNPQGEPIPNNPQQDSNPSPNATFRVSWVKVSDASGFPVLTVPADSQKVGVCLMAANFCSATTMNANLIRKSEDSNSVVYEYPGLIDVNSIPKFTVIIVDQNGAEKKLEYDVPKLLP